MKPSKSFCLSLAFIFLAVGCKKKPTPTTTLLHQAAKAGDAQRVRSLISGGANVDAKNIIGNTPLYEAAQQGHKDIVELLVTKGADVNAKNISGRTPLHRAAEAGDVKLVQSLISNGADVNLKDWNQGANPLHYAVDRGHRDMAELLIAKGADVNAKDNRSQTPLEWAQRQRNMRRYREIVVLLRKHGAKE